ncbi:hypothetical protein KIN20_013081 [Parelaphostrongylus tenuis]|uniref:Uncharacterized protein n=1 Tax=Parelaphostrongylus tenuis TaxID=148309 RepID=A0AAD5QNJ6_PARTN|nr:hypothetical protein KIN20_013081 [Parelaphostrongylus tenuis]
MSLLLHYNYNLLCCLRIFECLPCNTVISGEKDGEGLGKGDWEALKNEKSETMLQALTVSANEDAGNGSGASMDKNVHTPEDSENEDDGTDDAQRALLNVDIVVGD